MSFCCVFNAFSSLSFLCIFEVCVSYAFSSLRFQCYFKFAFSKLFQVCLSYVYIKFPFYMHFHKQAYFDGFMYFGHLLNSYGVCMRLFEVCVFYALFLVCLRFICYFKFTFHMLFQFCVSYAISSLCFICYFKFAFPMQFQVGVSYVILNLCFL